MQRATKSARRLRCFRQCSASCDDERPGEGAGLPDINKLPADRESVFYFNVREIPPKSNKLNTLQIALQTRIKLFWRPKALENTSMKSPWQHKVTLIRNGQDFTVNNLTPYYCDHQQMPALKKAATPPAGFTPLMMEPKPPHR